MKNNVTEDMTMECVLADEVVDVIKHLKDSSCGWDDISTAVVKTTYTSFIVPITHILNISITKGVFPNELKIARVIPLFKSGDSMIFANYRPVSILPVFSKILERLMYKRLLTFINKNGILYSYQFGFRSEHSPELALLFLVDKVSTALENGDFVLGLLLDFSKAFDTVNHDILYLKLEKYGIRGTALNMFKSYLSNRQQYVVYDGVKSENKKIICGVPQGSILGPLLFLLYINDLAGVSSKIFSLLFADDSNVFMTGKDPNQLIRSMNNEISKVVDWLRVNKLSLNLKKTHFIFFRKQRTRVRIFEELIIDNVKIDMKDDTKFLGVILDKNLNFGEHIRYIKGKVSRGLGILYKCRRLFTHETLLTLYNSFVFPYFNYCVSVWGNTFSSYLEPLIKMQKRAVRIVAGAERNSHTSPIFKRLNTLKLSQIYLYKVQLFAFKFHKTQRQTEVETQTYNDKLPNIFMDFFQRNGSFHVYNTRHQNEFRPPFFHSSKRSKSIKVDGVRTYNYFLGKLNIESSFISYKIALKKYIIVNDLSLNDLTLE